MKQLRKILFPFSLLYGLVVFVRNLLFDKGFFKSYNFNIPVIAVGNLSLGGTGKTPQIEYLIRLLSNKYVIATLSRGYKRKSKGFVLANSNVNAQILGDEPFQMYQKFKNIQVAVDVNRKQGIEKLLQQKLKPQVILLDDAFQHRKVKAGFYILLTDFNNLYCNDLLLPAGNLRENTQGAFRANIIIVTKCPPKLSSVKQKQISEKLNVLPKQKIFFSTILYDDFLFSENEKIAVSSILNTPKLVIAGIANPKLFFEHFKDKNTQFMSFPDHHNFSEKEIQDIKNKAKEKIIITTEKDFVRLKERLPQKTLFYLPIQTKFICNSEDFDQTIKNFVENN